MRTVNDLQVGDVVHWVDVNGKGRISEGAVSKVGYKLVSVGRLSFRKDTLKTNDEFGHQTLITDLEKYKEDQETAKLLWDIRQHLSARQPSISLANARKAAEFLGMTT